MVSATLGFCCSARTFAEPGRVATTTCSPVHAEPIGITRGAPSVPTYASRTGIDDPSNSWEIGLASTSATSWRSMVSHSSRTGSRTDASRGNRCRA